jgi:hypothetical protein
MLAVKQRKAKTSSNLEVKYRKYQIAVNAVNAKETPLENKDGKNGGVKQKENDTHSALAFGAKLRELCGMIMILGPVTSKVGQGKTQPQVSVLHNSNR